RPGAVPGDAAELVPADGRPRPVARHEPRVPAGPLGGGPDAAYRLRRRPERRQEGKLRPTARYEPRPSPAARDDPDAEPAAAVAVERQEPAVGRPRNVVVVKLAPRDDAPAAAVGADDGDARAGRRAERVGDRPPVGRPRRRRRVAARAQLSSAAPV